MAQPTTALSDLLSAAAIAAALLATSPAAAAGVNRAWVSGHGTDAAGCGAPTAPCRSLQYAEDDILSAGGEIDILDPAGYGSISITKALSIVNDGVGTAGVQQTLSQDAIFIDVGPSDAVTLRGLTIDGLGVALDGVGLAEAGKLTIANCVIRHFTDDGVHLQQGSGQLNVEILATITADNADNGFDISPSGDGRTEGVIDHSDAIDNGDTGVVVSGVNTLATDNVAITVANSNLSGNIQYGLYSAGSVGIKNALAVIRNDVADYNSYGYYIDAGSVAKFSRTESLNNLSDDIFVSTGATAYSFGDNAVFNLSGSLAKIPSE